MQTKSLRYGSSSDCLLIIMKGITLPTPPSIGLSDIQLMSTPNYIFGHSFEMIHSSVTFQVRRRYSLNLFNVLILECSLHGLQFMYIVCLNQKVVEIRKWVGFPYKVVWR